MGWWGKGVCEEECWVWERGGREALETIKRREGWEWTSRV